MGETLWVGTYHDVTDSEAFGVKGVSFLKEDIVRVIVEDAKENNDMDEVAVEKLTSELVDVCESCVGDTIYHIENTGKSLKSLNHSTSR